MKDKLPSAFLSTFGCYEMELAAFVIAEKSLTSAGTCVICPKDFLGRFQQDGDTEQPALDGFCLLLLNGWLDRGTYNGTFVPTNHFLERIANARVTIA